MQDNKQRILDLLEINGGRTTDELSDNLDISATAVRRHLSFLMARDVIYRRKEQRGVGRPCYVYELKNGASHGCFSRAGVFARSLFEDLLELADEEEANEAFRLGEANRYQQYVTQNTGETLRERIAWLAQLLEHEGRLTTWQQLGEGCYILREHNCPYRELAEKLNQPCRFEMALLGDMLKADIQRQSHIIDGDVACVYRIAGRDQAEEERSDERVALPSLVRLELEAV
jgi:predicted ArsR family transcriptional regulator